MRTDVSRNAVSKSKRVPESRVTNKSVKLSTFQVFTVKEFIGVLKSIKVFVIQISFGHYTPELEPSED
jgi:hypothetical protein